MEKITTFCPECLTTSYLLPDEKEIICKNCGAKIYRWDLDFEFIHGPSDEMIDFNALRDQIDKL